MAVTPDSLSGRRGTARPERGTGTPLPWWVYPFLVGTALYLLDSFSSRGGPNNLDRQVFPPFASDSSSNSRCAVTSFEPGLSTFGVPVDERGVRVESAAQVFRRFDPVLVEGLGVNYRVRVVKAARLNNCSNPSEMVQRIREASPRVLSGDGGPLYFDILTRREIEGLTENFPGRPVLAVGLAMEVPDDEGRFGYYASDLVVILEGGLEIHPLVYEEVPTDDNGVGVRKRWLYWAQAPQVHGDPYLQRVKVWNPKEGRWQEMPLRYPRPEELDKQ